MQMLGIKAAVSELEEHLFLEERRPFTFQGAKGFSQGAMSYADKVDTWGKRIWSILMVKGPLSQTVLKYGHFDLSATRIDLRVDVAMSSRCPDLAERYYKFMGGTLSKARFISSLTGQTLNPEPNRDATYYGRLYDKSAEYNEDLGWVWRYELEIKRRAAPQIQQILLECHDIESFIRDTVFGVFSAQWKVPVPKAGHKPKLNYAGISAVSTEQKLDWIRRNVAPSVQRLVKLGLEDEVIAAMGLEYKQDQLIPEDGNVRDTEAMGI
jgi:hypothetical protein